MEPSRMISKTFESSSNDQRYDECWAVVHMYHEKSASGITIFSLELGAYTWKQIFMDFDIEFFKKIFIWHS